jgi:RNA polymerase sigma-70 factor (ECF subfamily)
MWQSLLSGMRAWQWCGRDFEMTQLITDEILAARVLAGDRGAFRVLTERHYSAVYRLSRSILKSSEDAEDAAQEVFVKAFQSLSQYSGRGAFAGWLRRLTVNHCLNRRESAAAKCAARSSSLELMAETLSAGVEADPVRTLLRREARHRIAAEMNELPSQQRAAMALRVLEDLSYEDIADVMGVPVNSVRSWLHRGRARLRCALETEEAGV